MGYSTKRIEQLSSKILVTVRIDAEVVEKSGFMKLDMRSRRQRDPEAEKK